jgi:hypothetical protein
MGNFGMESLPLRSPTISTFASERVERCVGLRSPTISTFATEQGAESISFGMRGGGDSESKASEASRVESGGLLSLALMSWRTSGASDESTEALENKASEKGVMLTWLKGFFRYREGYGGGAF